MDFRLSDIEGTQYYKERIDQADAYRQLATAQTNKQPAFSRLRKDVGRMLITAGLVLQGKGAPDLQKLLRNL